MQVNGYIAAILFANGTAILALWTYFRWPGLTPENLKGAFLHLIASAVGVQTASVALVAAGGGGASRLLAILMGVAVPALTYAFLAFLWLVHVLRGMLNGAYR